jgi:hypothetical protein
MGAGAVVGSLLAAGFVAGMFVHFALRIPIEITINEDQEIRFRARMRTVSIPVGDIVMIGTGRWFDPNHVRLDVVHNRGRLTMINRFSEFRDFLATVKDLNPSVEIKGY